MKTNLNLRDRGAAEQAVQAPQREIELPALVPMAWSVAGGMLGGGAIVALLVMTGQLSGHALMSASAAFYTLGALVGLVHGVVLGIFGRPEGETPRQALRAMVHGMLYLVPVLLLGWLGAGWVAALPIALRGHHVVATAITVVAWILMLGVVVFAVNAGLDAAKLAYRRWPDRVPGTLLVAATFVALALSAAFERPTVWFIGVRLTGFGSVLFVFALTFWFYGPIITTGLALLRRAAPLLPLRGRGARAWREVLAKGGVAVAAGLLVALLAVPFHEGVLGVPTSAERVGAVWALSLAVGDAVTDELLLRLFVFTAVFVVAARHMRRNQWAVWLAVGVAAAGDLMLHSEDLYSLGLPSAWVVFSYVVARMAIPAVLFGYLFWRRGLGTAVTAHATAGAALGILAL